MKTDKPRIFIVEDDKLLSFVEERLVKKLGYDIAGKASNGEQAIEKIEVDDPDLIIMDIRLEGSIDGIETMKEIRKFSSAPVIFLSGDSKDETQSRIEEISNCVNYLVKPVNAEDLRSPLKKVFENSPKDDVSNGSKNNDSTKVASA